MRVGELVLRLDWWGGRVRSLLFDLVLAAAAIAAALTESRPAPPMALLVPLAVVGFGALVVRRRFPLVAFAVGLAGLFGGLHLIPVLIGLHAVASRYGPAARTWVVVAVALVGFVFADGAEDLDEWQLLLLVGSLIVLTPTLLGLWSFQRRKLLAALRDRAEHAERERDLLAERAVADERRRIAREMHDVVAHRVSVIALQAGALSVTPGGERTAEVAEVIRKTSATALTELRDMLRVLRDDTSDSPAPAPALGGIDALARDFRATGADVDLDLPDSLPDASGAVGRAAYRVVQEALTNAGKHAPGAPVRVSVGAVDDDLVVEVSNRGGGRHPAAVPGSGYGLIGMRERVALAGGAVRSGPAPGGGYVVRAQFPLRSDDENP
ncbi:sensor histidine kinase [Umezawaea sp. Da 62-37]|uniref:sensor histidine kinase n=1 Tax=Umezawaea sp. Da 62-37 TaxID=3075927 RepID=UPI0028F6DA18|nr:sensor histidine kinase [Umezawaea sp. Da 62-37]WNV89037.1 sensor histidine kinase [Umezawaea sp. Da 62-37]